jgi:hypothetical protein
LWGETTVARIRSIKPEFWSDRKLAGLSRDARLLYIALWNIADEHGRAHGDPRYIKGHCFPYDDDLRLVDIGRLLDELIGAGRVRRYEAEGDPYLHLLKLAEHQRLEPGKSASRLPEPPALTLSPDSAQIFSDESAPIVVQQVAGSMLHVAGSREHVASLGDARIVSDRPADEVWDAVMAACRVDTRQVTDSARGGYNRAVASLKAAGATSTEIHRRASIYRITFPSAALTPLALSKQWAMCASEPPVPQPRPSRNQVMLSAAMARAQAADAAEARGELA